MKDIHATYRHFFAPRCACGPFWAALNEKCNLLKWLIVGLENCACSCGKKSSILVQILLAFMLNSSFNILEGTGLLETLSPTPKADVSACHLFNSKCTNWMSHPQESSRPSFSILKWKSFVMPGFPHDFFFIADKIENNWSFWWMGGSSSLQIGKKLFSLLIRSCYCTYELHGLLWTYVNVIFSSGISLFALTKYLYGCEKQWI